MFLILLKVNSEFCLDPVADDSNVDVIHPVAVRILPVDALNLLPKFGWKLFLLMQ